jgi:hypothetical protein
VAILGAEIVDEAVVTPDSIVLLGLAFRGAKVLLSAAELDVFTVLAQGPLDLETLRERVGIDRRGARDFLDALVALRMLERHEDGRYGNTPESDRYLDRRKPAYIGGMLERLNAREYGIWASMTAALRTGEPQTGKVAAGGYAALYADPGLLETFVKGMAGGSVSAARSLAAKFPWDQYGTVIDIGAGQGCVPAHVALAHPHITGGGFDLPPVKPFFDSYVGGLNLSNRLQFYVGDFFKDPLPSAEVLVMGRILHNWNLPTKKVLLGKAYEALPPGGALIVFEGLIDDERRSNAQGLLDSLNMLIVTVGGFDYTGADCMGWMREAGFRDTRVEPLADVLSMVVGLK